MATIQYTADDGSVVAFVDPAGVQAAVDAAIAALPTPTGTGETVEDVKVENTDGTSETFTPEASVEAAPVEEATA